MLFFIGPLLFFCLWICECKEVSARLELELNYTNFGHYARTGWCDFFDHKCDVYFIICIWNASSTQSTVCDVARKKTPFISDSHEIALTGQKTIEIPLLKPIPKFIKIRIEVWDADISSSDDIIAKFLSGDTQLLSHQPFHQVSLLKMDTSSYNVNVNLQLSVQLTCNPNYYGEQCQTFCKPDSERYYCGANGEHKCIPGWRGEFCQLIDTCFLKPCAPHARCLNTDDAKGRICYCNGGSGPECYRLRDPCSPSPCENGGICLRTGSQSQDFICKCKNHWHGPTCNKRRFACEEATNALKAAGNHDNAVCLNGGKCQDHPTDLAYFCLCTRGWKGVHCEEPDYNGVFVALCITFSVLIIIGILSFLIWKIRNNSRQAEPTLELLRKQPKTKNVVEPAIAMTTDAISNDLYGHLLWDSVVSGKHTTGNDCRTQDATLREKTAREGSICYASLLWDKEPEQTPTKADTRNTDKLTTLHKNKFLKQQSTDAL